THFTHYHPLSFPTRRSSDLRAATTSRISANTAPCTILMPTAISVMCLIPATVACTSRAGELFIREAPIHLNLLGPTFSRTCWIRSEEHTSELQSRVDLVCRL